MAAFIGEYAAYSIAHAFSDVFDGICEASYGSPSAAAAARRRLYRLCRLYMLHRFSISCNSRCFRICGTCGYGYRDHSTVLCRFKVVPVGAV